MSISLNRNHLAGAALGFDDVGHPADDASLHLIAQVVVVQAGAA